MLSQVPTVEVGLDNGFFFFSPTLNKRTEFSSRSLQMVESGLPTPSNCIDAGVQSTIECMLSLGTRRLAFSSDC